MDTNEFQELVLKELKSIRELQEKSIKADSLHPKE